MNEICHFTLMISLCQHRKTAKQSTLQHIDGSEEIFLSSSTFSCHPQQNTTEQNTTEVLKVLAGSSSH